MGSQSKPSNDSVTKGFDTFLASPVSLYIHLPWCLKKCPYCDFNSHATSPNEFPEKTYTEKIILDLEKSVSLLSNRRVDSIFIGGGTPSLFSPESINKILAACYQFTQASNDCEITMEANPGTFESEKFSEFLAVGVNRLSLGVQSFKDHYLQALGRIHNAKESLSAIETAADLGFENINIDLMFGLPEQSIEDALEEISLACQQAVNHISYYQLTLEPNTVFHRYPPKLPNTDVSWDIQCSAIELLKQSGFQRYEVSAYSKDGAQCRHNNNYWQYGDYLGIGAGAHSKITNSHGISRHQRTRQPESYINAIKDDSHIVQERSVEQDDIIFEFMLNNLRLVKGFNRHQFEIRTNMSWETVRVPLDKFIQEGLMQESDGDYQASELGYRFLDQLVERFLPSHSNR